MKLVKQLSPKIESSISNLERAVFVVNSDKTREYVVGAIRNAKTAKATVVEFFRESKEHADKAHKAICANQDFFTDRCDVIEKDGKAAVTKWDDEQEKIRLKKQQKLQAEEDAKAERERKRLEKKAAKVKTPEYVEALLDEADSIVAVEIPLEGKNKTKGESTSKVWKYRVINKEKVPKEWWILNDKGLTAFAKSTKGNVAVPGIQFYSVSSLAIKI